MRFFALSVAFLLVNVVVEPCSAQIFYGLAPSPESRARAEALTVDPKGSDALFYNPAAIPGLRAHLSLLGIEMSADSQSSDVIAKIYRDKQTSSQVDLQAFYEKFDTDQPTFFETTARAIDFATPILSLSSFVAVRGSGDRIEDFESPFTQPYRDFRLGVDTGIIGGVGLRLWKLSFGAAYYLLGRTAIRGRPTDDQIAGIRDSIAADSFQADQQAISEYTELYYGGTTGQNFGIIYNWWEGNPSGIGVSILNASGSKFKSKIPLERQDFKKVEEKVLAQADAYDIELKVPDAIEQVVNVGVNLGYTQDKALFSLGVAVDYNDIGGNTIDNKLASAWHAGVNLPDEIALALSSFIYDKGDHRIHLGLLGIRAFGGIRPGAYATEGATISFHSGLNKQFSLVKLEITGYRLHPARNPEPQASTQKGRAVGMAGFSGNIGLTLMY
jgi:hypothetical protein